jgi:predicted RNase H-like HicB family nuclease
MSHRYAVLYEKGPTSWGASVPDLPGCIAVGSTRGEVESLIREAIEFHLEGLQEEGLAYPERSYGVGVVEVSIAKQRIRRRLA